jgi:hypothetical protein
MNLSTSVVLFGMFGATIAYLIYEHRQLNAPKPAKPPPDMLDMPVSASAMPGDRVGPGATSNQGWYLSVPNAAMIPGA